MSNASDYHSPWQEIATAPRTGEHIIVAIKGRGFGICGGKMQPWVDVAHWWNHPGEEGFYPSMGPDEPLRSLTHWMPVPDFDAEDSDAAR